MKRRQLLKMAGAATFALPFWESLCAPSAWAASGKAQRVIFFYFPDGIIPDRWHATGSETQFTLPVMTQPLAGLKDYCLFLNGIKMVDTEDHSHPGNSKKLLTGRAGAGSISIDTYLGQTIGRDRAIRHLHLGVQATKSADNDSTSVTFSAAGNMLQPNDNPADAFNGVFGAVSTASTVTASVTTDSRLSLIDIAKSELGDLKAKLGGVEQAKLAAHLESFREVEQRIQAQQNNNGGGEVSCQRPAAPQYDDAWRYQDEKAPNVLRLQIDVMLQAMACNLTKVGTLQLSRHTSKMIMDPSVYSGIKLRMESHESSHYQGDDKKIATYTEQRRWMMQEFAYLLERLKSTPEPTPGLSGNMLDHSLVVTCSEIGDGNIHSPTDMPFIVAGKGGGAVRSGRSLNFANNRLNNELWVTMANALGDPITRFGQDGAGALPGVLA